MHNERKISECENIIFLSMESLANILKGAVDNAFVFWFIVSEHICVDYYEF